MSGAARGEAWVVVDLGFGDAGKGTITDFLVRERGASLVVRFNGGAQAGHTVVTDDGRHHVFAQLGAGSFVPGVGTHLGPAFALHPGGLRVEAERLAAIGVPDALDRLTIDGRATVITPFQQAAGRLRELLRQDEAHGTCGVGVGEAVADRLAGLEDTVCAADLADPGRLVPRLAAQQRRKRAEVPAARRVFDARAAVEVALLDDREAPERIAAEWTALATRLAVLPPDRARARLASAQVSVFEGAQGVLLDETWGFHPHTTWSDCTPRGALALLHGLDRRVRRLGVVRGYATRHGRGPFPSWAPAFDQALPEAHNHDLGWQGRFRRGPLDLVLLRYALQVCGGVDGLALTCLDRLAPAAKTPVCVGYEVDGPLEGLTTRGSRVVELEPGAADDLAAREALGRALGWVRPIHQVVPTGRLSAFVAEHCGVPVALESHGPTASAKRWAAAALAGLIAGCVTPGPPAPPLVVAKTEVALEPARLPPSALPLGRVDQLRFDLDSAGDPRVTWVGGVRLHRATWDDAGTWRLDVDAAAEAGAALVASWEDRATLCTSAECVGFDAEGGVSMVGPSSISVGIASAAASDVDPAGNLVVAMHYGGEPWLLVASGEQALTRYEPPVPDTARPAERPSLDASAHGVATASRTGSGAVSVRTWSGQAWTEALAASEGSAPPAVVRTVGGAVAAWSTGEAIRVWRVRDGAGTDLPTPGAAGDVAPALVDGADGLVIAWQHGGTLHTARLVAGKWIPLGEIATSGVPGPPALDLGTGGAPWLLWTEVAQQDGPAIARIRKWTGSSWEPPAVGGDAPAEAIDALALAVTPAVEVGWTRSDGAVAGLRWEGGWVPTETPVAAPVRIEPDPAAVDACAPGTPMVGHAAVGPDGRTAFVAHPMGPGGPVVCVAGGARTVRTAPLPADLPAVPGWLGDAPAAVIVAPADGVDEMIHVFAWDGNAWVVPDGGPAIAHCAGPCQDLEVASDPSRLCVAWTEARPGGAAVGVQCLARDGA